MYLATFGQKYCKDPIYFWADSLQIGRVVQATGVRSGSPSLAWEGRQNLTMN